jgi:hypothetical protein
LPDLFRESHFRPDRWPERIGAGADVPRTKSEAVCVRRTHIFLTEVEGCKRFWIVRRDVMKPSGMIERTSEI